MLFHATVPGPLGPVLLRSDGDSLIGLYFVGQKDCPDLPGQPPMRPDTFDPSAGTLGGRPIRSLKAVRGSTGALFQQTPHAATEPAMDAGPHLLQGDTPAGARAIFEQTRKELAEYLSGRRRAFDMPLDPQGTIFQKKVWDALLAIPYGETVSYGDVARMAGMGAGHGRAVGAAVGRNPISIIIPCHRVLASGGRLNGYSGGLDRKACLLEIEGFTLS